jgi:hypothetical protein
MMKGYLMPAFAAALALTCVSLEAKEVNLADHDRMELRQRADALRAENALGGTRGEGARDEIRGEARLSEEESEEAPRETRPQSPDLVLKRLRRERQTSVCLFSSGRARWQPCVTAGR